MKIEEQDKVLENNKKRMLVSASAGSGKTYIMMKYITFLICEKRVPVKKFLVLTFTKAAATQMKERLLKNLKEKQKENPNDEFLTEQIDALSTANISTIHAFCEKFLKKYANLLSLGENFSVVDEDVSLLLRRRAFEAACKRLEEERLQDFAELFSSFKNDKQKLCDIVMQLESLANSVADKEAFVSANEKQSEVFFDEAASFLFKFFQKQLQESLLALESLHVQDFFLQLCDRLKSVLDSKNIFEMSANFAAFSYPTHPLKKVVGEDVIAVMQVIKKNIMQTKTKLTALQLDNPQNVQKQRSGVLEKILIELFKIYEQEENKLKSAENCLDFYDLEKYMSILSCSNNLFDGLEYVFVDEYQDTNKIQERIIKNVAKNCNFVAVGDVKQGIYGFRLASSEIFLKDLRDFEADEQSAVNFLKCNFRSAQKVLDFVNDVFGACMTKEVAGVDYLATSMLTQADNSRFVDDGAKAVNIDLIAPKEPEEDKPVQLYSVKDAKLSQDESNVTMLKDIKRQILKVLSSKISEDGVLRDVRYNDIAIISRGRNLLFNQLETFLQQSGIPVVSNSRKKLLDEGEMKMLLCLLKLILLPNDDIACTSVLLSGLYHKDVQDLLEAKHSSGKSICQIAATEAKFSDFFEDLKTLQNTYPIFGLRKCLEWLFQKRNYRAYINLHHPNLNTFVDKFLDEVEKYDFDLPMLISHFETVDIVVSPEISVVDDSVLLTTVHDSKGLEYPIVFLINCDKSFSKSTPFDVKINERFGMAVKQFDKDNNNEVMSLRMCAIDESQKQECFVEELMIFYVALTRAKNRLYLFGHHKDSFFNKLSVKECDCYFDLIFFALADAKAQFEQSGKFVDDKLCINFIEDVDFQQEGQKQDLAQAEFSEEVVKQIEDYLNFSYNLSEAANFKLKESVTSLNNKNAEDVFVKFNNQHFNFSESFIEIGNAYHFALKAIDFEKVKNLETLQQEMQKNAAFFDEQLLDKNLLLKNIEILKPLTDGKKVFKEKEFIMKEKICNLVESELADEILIQGVVDLFVMQNDKIVLVDYKYSNLSDEGLLKKYKNQLFLYKNAIENAFKVPVSAIYLLSLKQSKLIELQF